MCFSAIGLFGVLIRVLRWDCVENAGFLYFEIVEGGFFVCVLKMYWDCRFFLF